MIPPSRLNGSPFPAKHIIDAQRAPQTTDRDHSSDGGVRPFTDSKRIEQLQLGNRVRRAPSDYSPDHIAQYTASQIAGIPANDFQHFSQATVASIKPEAIAGLHKAQLSKLPLKSYRGFTAQHITHLQPSIFSKISYGAFQEMLGMSLSEEATTKATAGSREFGLIYALTKEQISQIPAKHFQGFPSWAVSALRPETVAGLSRDQFLKIPKKVFSKWQIPYLKPQFFSEISEQDFRDLLLNPSPSILFSRQLAGLTRQQIAQIPASYFRNFNDVAIQHVKPEVVGGISTAQFFNIQGIDNMPGKLGGFYGFTTEQIPHLRPEIFSQMPEGVFLELFHYDQTFYSKFPLLSTSAKVRVRDRIQALTEAQLEALPPRLVVTATGFFYDNLTGNQSKWISPAQISWMPLRIFVEGSLVRKFFSVWSVKQIQGITHNQLRRIPAPILHQVQMDYQHLGTTRLEECLSQAQLSSLTWEQGLQLTIAQPTYAHTHRYAAYYYSRLTPYEIQQIFVGDISTIHPKVVRQLGLEFLRKLSPDQFESLTREQKEMFDAGDLLNVQEQLQQRQPESLRRAGVRHLERDEIPKLGDGFPTNLLPEEVRTLTSEQLGSMTLRQVSQQGPEFFRSLSVPQFAAFTAEQRRAINPKVFSYPRMEQLWEKLLPIQLRVLQQRQRDFEAVSLEERHMLIFDLIALSRTHQQRSQQMQQLQQLQNQQPLAPDQENRLSLLQQEENYRIYLLGLQQSPLPSDRVRDFRRAQFAWRRAYQDQLAQLPHIQFMLQLPLQQQQHQWLQLPAQQQAEWGWWWGYKTLRDLQAVTQFPLESLTEHDFTNIVRNLTKEQVENLPIRVWQKLGNDFLLRWLSPEVLSSVPPEVFLGVGESFVRNLSPARVKHLTVDQVLNLGRCHLLRYLSIEQVLQLRPECFARIPLPIFYSLPPPTQWRAEQVAQLPPKIFKHIYDRYPSATLHEPLDVFSRVTFGIHFYPPHNEGIKSASPEVFSLLTAPHLNILSEEAIKSLTHEQIKRLPLETVKSLTARFWKKLLAKQFQYFNVAQLRTVSSETWREMDKAFVTRLEKRNILTPEQLSSLREPPTKRFRIDSSHIALIIESMEEGDQERALSQQALENYLMKRPDMEAYKMTYQGNQRWQWKKYHPESKNWIVHEEPLPQEAIGKIDVIGHGANNQFAGIADPNRVINEFKAILTKVRKIDRLNLNICGITSEIGKRIVQAFSFGSTVIQTISGSHYPVYVTGNEEGSSSGKSGVAPGHRIYDVHGELRHGVNEGRWLIYYDYRRGGWVTGHYRTAKHSKIGRVIHPAPEHAGPFHSGGTTDWNDEEVLGTFGAIRHLQKLSQSRKSLNLSDADFRAFSASYEEAQAIQREKQETQALDRLSRDYRRLNRDILKLAGAHPDGESFFISKKGSNEVTVYDPAKNKDRVISIEDEEIKGRLQKYEKDYGESMKSLRQAAPYLNCDDRGNLALKPGMLESLKAVYRTRGAKAMLGFSSGIFGVRAWASYLMKEGSEDSMPLGLKVAAYWNLADATAGVSDDVVRGMKSVVQIFTHRGSTLAEGAVKVLRSVGGALKVINFGFTAGSMAFDIHLLATAKDEETRIHAGMSLGMTLASLGVTVMAGPVAAFPVIALSLVASWVVGFILDTKRVVKHYQDQADQGRELLTNFGKLFSEGLKIKDGVLMLQETPILEIDAQNKRIVINSPVIQKLEKVLRPDGSRAANGSLYNYILSEEKLLTEALNLPPIISLKEEDGKKLVILPESTYQPNLILSEDGIYPSLPFLGRGTSLYDPIRLEHQALENQLKTQGIISSPIRSVKEATPDAASLEKPLTVKLSKSGPSIWSIPPQAGPNRARYSFEASAEGGDVAMINNLHEGVHLTLKDTGESGSLFCINVPEADLSERDHLKIEEQDGKRTLSIQHNNKSISRMDISQLGHSSIRMIGKRGTWNIYPNKNIVLQRMAFRAPIAEMQDYLEDLPREWKESEVTIELLPETPLPRPPAPPTRVKTATQSQLAIHGWVEVTTKTITTPTITTIETTTVHPMTAYTSMQRPAVTTTREVVETPKDDPIHLQAKSEWDTYLNKLKGYYQKEVTTTSYINAPVDGYGKGRLVYHKDLLTGAKIVESNGTTSDHFFFQAGRGMFQRIKDFTNEESRCQLPISDPESQIKDVRIEGDRILFTHVVPCGKEGRALEFRYQWEANESRPHLKGVYGLQANTQVGRYSLEEEALLKRVGLIDIQGGQEFSGWVELRNATESKEYISCEKGSKTIVVGKDYQLECVLIQAQELYVVLYSAKRKAVLLVKVFKNKLSFIDARRAHALVQKMEGVEAIRPQGETEILLIEDGGKQLRRINPFTNQSMTIPVPPMVEAPERQQPVPIVDLEKFREDYGLNFFNLFYLPGSSVEFAEEEGDQIRIGQRIDYGDQGASVLFKYLFMGEESLLEAVSQLPEEMFREIQQKLKQAKGTQERQVVMKTLLELLGLGDYTKSSRFPPKVAPWLKIEGVSGAMSYVNTEDLREVSVPPEAMLVQSDGKTLVWNSQTKELFLLPNTGQNLILLLNGTKVDPYKNRQGIVSWITDDGREVIREIDRNGEVTERWTDIRISPFSPPEDVIRSQKLPSYSLNPLDRTLLLA